MNEWLAEMYGTGGQADEAQEKVAELELFAKLAADNGIDLTTLEPEQVSALYAETFGKVAAEDEDDEDEEEEEAEDKAKAEHEAAKEGAAKFAEADIMGRTMAHAFVNELDEIDGTKTAGRASQAYRKGKAGAKKLYGAAKRQAKKGLRAEARTSGRIGGALMSGASKAGKKVGLLKKNIKQTAGRRKAVGRAALGAGALGAGGAAYGASRMGKESSALDYLAAEEAVKIAAADGWDTDECIDLLNQVLEAGPEESEKIAYVEDTADAIQVRGLELLDECGYDVDWDQVFGE
jgi:hypothetical protein